jgi:hypothetical protein
MTILLSPPCGTRTPDSHGRIPSTTTERERARESSPSHPSLGPVLSVPPIFSEAAPSNATSIKQDVLLWSIVIPAISVALLARTMFTCLRQDPAAGSHPPSSFMQLFQANLQITQLLLGCLPRCLAIMTLSAACSAAALLAPSWYLEGGREQLLAAARLLPKAIAVLQLLLLPAPPPGTLQRVWLQTCTVGAKGLLGVLTWPLLFPVSALAILSSQQPGWWMTVGQCTQLLTGFHRQGPGTSPLASVSSPVEYPPQATEHIHWWRNAACAANRYCRCTIKYRVQGFIAQP